MLELFQDEFELEFELEAVDFATLERVDWFNHRRLLEPVGNIPPEEAEAYFYAALEQPAIAAKLETSSLRTTRRGSLPWHAPGIVVPAQRPRRVAAYAFFFLILVG